MNCKYCNAELAEDAKVCPECGKELETAEVKEETAAAEEVTAETVAEEVVTEEISEEAVSEEPPVQKPANTKKTTAAIIAIVLVAGILIGLVAGSLGGKSAAAPTVPPTEAAEPVVIPSNGDPASPQCKASYTVSDEEAIAAADVVVATMGGKELTNAMLQAYYWQEIFMFLQENGSYAQFMGLDISVPLDQQLMDLGEASVSWQQFFLDGAIATWKNYQALALEAEEEGHQMDAEILAELESLPKDLEAGAANSGAANADELVQQNVGAGCTLEDYVNYVTTYYQGMAYYYDFCDAIDPTAEQIEAFYAENEAYFTENGVTQDSRFVNVRHVLLQPEYSEVGEDGYPVFTDEAWETCRQEVDKIYNGWQEGDKSEESFSQLAMEHSVDGSAANGGLYENVYVGQMVPEFEQWCFDESRMPGDHGLVRTQYGYHIMFFSAHRSWQDYVKEIQISNIASEKIPATVEKYPAEVDFSLVQLSNVDFY